MADIDVREIMAILPHRYPLLLIDRITERVRNPSTRPGSPEEAAALKAAFVPGPKGKVDFSEATGEITIRMD